MGHSVRRVALVGTGIMGAPIAGHVMDAGFRLTVNTRTRAKAEGLVERGALWADTPAEAARDADLILTMVGSPADVEDAYLGSDGILDAAPKGAYLVDLTTSSPQLARELHDAAEVMGKHALDCPVTGGEDGAKAGTLTLIVGATEQDARPALPVLEAFSGRRFFFGKPGAGQLAKLCNQASLVSCMVGWADALALAREGGIDEGLVLAMLSSGMGGSTALARLAPKALEGDYRPGFLVEHLRKDLQLALDEALELGVTLPGVETGKLLYDTLSQAGGGRLGTQAIDLLYEDEATGTAAGLDWSALDAPEEPEGPAGQRYHLPHHHL